MTDTEQDNEMTDTEQDEYEGNESFRALLDKVSLERGFDFHAYTVEVVSRRLAKRLTARGVGDYVAYSFVLDRDADEYNKLLDALTINVTSFFRDREAFDVLGETLLQELSEGGLQGEGTILVWSAACSTGEEPYSLAILLSETQETLGLSREIRIMATDIDQGVLKKAEKGLFSASSVKELPSHLVEKYCVPSGDHFKIRPEIRAMVTFQHHNFLTDHFFSDMDLILCRNVLIYFKSNAQLRIMRKLRQSLKPNGLIMIGRSEMPLRGARQLFDIIHFPSRLYRNREQSQSSVTIQPGDPPPEPIEVESKKPQELPVTPQHPPAPRVSRQNLQEAVSRDPNRSHKKSLSIVGVNKIVVIGASAGGVEALLQLLPGFPSGVPAVILVVQHMSSQSESSKLSVVLDRVTRLRVREALDGQPIRPGEIVIAAPGVHLVVDGTHLNLEKSPKVCYVRPSVNVLFQSAAQTFGSAVVGVLLTGSGSDGATGCKKIKQHGGITIGQDMQSSKIFGMVAAAVRSKSIDFVLPLDKIASHVIELIKTG